MKKSFAVLTAILLLFGWLPIRVHAAEVEITSPSAILIEQSTGKVLYEKNADTPLRPASVTKIMTILLACEAVQEGRVSMEDLVTVSKNAAGYGGSTILLEEGEQITLANLIKGMCIASGNDAAIATAEYIGGSQDGFVEMMNRRAAELNMKNTHFVNPCGLDADGHVTTARDIALMSRELMVNFPEVTEYTMTWHEMMPHVWRSGPGETDMANTNKLIRSYDGMTGLKTGFTRLAKYSLSATATRGDLSLIAVIMGAETKDQRSTDVTALLNYGFGFYALQTVPTNGQSAGSVRVNHGMQSDVTALVDGDLSYLTRKGTASEPSLTTRIELASSVDAPIVAGDPLGTITYFQNDEEVGSLPLVAASDVEESNLWKILEQFLRNWLSSTFSPQ